MAGEFRIAVLAALLAAACTVSGAPPAAPAAALGMYGTDANLAPSAPTRTLRYADHSRGFADLRIPEGEGPFPLAVIFHGGCWKAGVADRHYMAPLATRWQQRGVATLNVDYREVGDGGGWRGSFDDWAASERLLDELATDPRIDLARITLVGHSAGALPAQWLASEQGPDGPVGTRSTRRKFDAIVFDGPADLARDQAPFDALCEFSSVAPFVGGTPAEVPGRYAALSPAVHRSRLGRLLFVQARLPSPDSGALDALRAAGVDVKVIENARASHFDIITPGTPAYEAVESELLTRMLK